MSTRRIVPLSQVEPEQQDLTQNCFYCICPKHDRKVKAVASVEVTTSLGNVGYYGICGNHAEVYPLTEEEEKRKPMLCMYCFPRLTH